MRKAIGLSLLTVIIAASRLFAVDGIAVAATWEGGWRNYGGFGDIYRYDISGSAVSSQKKIFAGQGRWATISPDGKWVAFFNEGDMSVSLVSSDGGAVTKLADIPYEKNADGKRPGDCHGSMDWPVGDWIYYNRGGTPEGYAAPEGSKEIFRVKHNDPASNELVVKFNVKVRRWDLSANAGWGSCQVLGNAIENPSNGNMVGGNYRFPFPSYCTRIEFSLYRMGIGCNIAISPSNRYYMGFNNVGHSVVHIKDGSLTPEDGTPLDRIADQESYVASHNTGHGLDHPRWSSNSDLWVCLHRGLDGRKSKIGSECLLLNWKSGKKIKLPKHGNQIESGDFLVKGLDGKIELSDGSLAQVTPSFPDPVAAKNRHMTQNTGVQPQLIHADRRLKIVLPQYEKCSITVSTLAGRKIRTIASNGSREIIVDKKGLAAANYLVSVRLKSGPAHQFITMIR